MASSYSTSLRLELIGTGEQSGSWGDTTNRNLGTLIEQAVAGFTAVTMGDANYTLTASNGTADEARAAVLNITSSTALTTQRSVICPSAPKVYVARNVTSGGQSLLFRTSGGNGVTIPNGATTFLYCNGTDVLSGLSHVPALNVTSVTSTSLSASTLATSASVTSPLVKMTPGDAPVSPVNGDIWYSTNAIRARVDNSSLIVAQRPIVLTVPGTASLATGASGFVSFTSASASLNNPGSFSTWFPYPGLTYPFTPTAGIYEVTYTGRVTSNLSLYTNRDIGASFRIQRDWDGAIIEDGRMSLSMGDLNGSVVLPFARTLYLSAPANGGISLYATNSSPQAAVEINVVLAIRYIGTA